MPAHDPSECELLDQLAEEFADRYRRGERPPLKEYLDKYPELADDIRALFPALVEMEQVKEETSDTAAVVELPPLQQVGDYRILREVGRGAMGVVYEAEQLSLGRRVALKVLAAHFAPDPQSLQRFRREARSAAKLHHTNIVPVFEVGQDGAVCYYAMQFIHGQSLDQIIEELRRLRRHSLPGEKHTLPESCATVDAARNADAVRPAVDQLAHSLLTGCFHIERAAALVADETSDRSEEGGIRSQEKKPVSSSSPSSLLPPHFLDSAVLPGQTGLSSVRTDRPHYFQSVAQIGFQIANALAYAHARKIIHRDIKPSNLLLDTSGVAWITDFGLAKTQEAALTSTGDIVGTLRYMSPERFRGEGDERSDVYALGLTLYEMLVLRPAFDARDRLQMIDQIKNQDPPRPRVVDRRIPRDLETIVVTAIHKDPKQRYPTAEAMAEDLRRFLADEPIKAKRTSHLARLRLWGRRHPALAALLLVLALATAGATALALHLRSLLAETEEAHLTEGMAKRQAELSRDRAAEAEKKARLREAEALVGQAHGTRLSRRPGQRFDALDALGKAAAIGRELGQPPLWFDHLRNEAIAALALPDVHITQEFDGFPPGTVRVELSNDFQLYVRSTEKGLCTIHRVVDNAEIARLPELGERAVASFGPGRLLAVCGSSGRFQLWDMRGAEPIRRVEEKGIRYWSFRRDGRMIALDHYDASISVYDMKTWRRVYCLPAGTIREGMHAELHPAEPFVACVSYVFRPVQVRDLRTGAVVASADPSWPSGNGACAWSPDGRTLTVPCGDSGAIQQYAFDPAAPALRPLRLLQGPHNGGTWLSYNPAGDRFVSCGWDGRVHLFDADSGQFLFSTPSLPKAADDYPRFDRTGQRLAAARIGDHRERVGIWSVADGREYRTLVHSGRTPTGGGKPAIHPGGRLAALGLDDGVAFFDLETGRELAHLLIAARRGTMAHLDGTGSLLTNNFAGLFRWPLRQENPENRDRMIVGPPKRLPFHLGDGQISTSRDGRVIAQCMWKGYGMQDYAGGWILHPNSPAPRWVLKGLSTGHCSVSPDGRWVAFGCETVDVFDAATGKRIWQSPARAEADYCRFSPDGRWLATNGDGGRLYAADTWEPGPQLGLGIPWDISPDSTLAILGQPNGIYRLVELASGHELARLEDPEQNTGAAAFTPDGAKLVIAARDGLRVWDLRRIRAELAKLGLDWQAPPLPAVPRGADATPLAAAPLALHLQVRDLQQWAKAMELVQQSQLHQRKKEHAKALEALRQAAKIAPNLAIPHNNLAWLLVTGPKELRDPTQALAEARKAVELAPEEWTDRNTLGVALYRAGQFAEAIPNLERSLREGQGQADAFDLFFLAMCHHRLDNSTKAKDYLERGKQWYQEHKGKLKIPGWEEELTAFQAEAESVLAQTPGEKAQK